MKTLRTTSGPFSERPYFSDEEIERTCLDALKQVDLLPREPSAVRIDRFIEKMFGVTPSYEDLPKGLLGFSQFDGGRVASVVVSKALDTESSAVAERRIRTTLAHEGGHGLLHAYLFAVAAPTHALFGDFSEPMKPKVLCRGERAAASQYTGEWWEFQANRAIGALLMPRHLVDLAVVPYTTSGSLGLSIFDQSRTEEAARDLADVFDVNPAAARIRLGQLYASRSRAQMLL
jgi:hypothetical protein